MSLHFAKLVFFIPYRHGTPSSFCGNGRQSVGRDAEGAHRSSSCHPKNATQHQASETTENTLQNHIRNYLIINSIEMGIQKVSFRHIKGQLRHGKR